MRIIAAIILFLGTFSNAQTVDTIAKFALVVDAETWTPLYAKNDREAMFPSSLTKLLTAYVAFDKIVKKEASFQTLCHISPNARDQEGSRTFLEVNTKVKLVTLLRGMIIQSGNDATVAIAECLGGSEQNYVAIMNATAKTLGMNATTFYNTTGLPHPQHSTTAFDLILLSRRLLNDFPQYAQLYKEQQFTYNNITQTNRNWLLSRDPSVDGLKTGFTDDAGYALIATAKRDGRRVITLVNGLDKIMQRITESAKLLEFAFSNFKNKTLLKAGSSVAEIPVYMGKVKTVSAVVEKDVVMTVPVYVSQKVEAKLAYPSSIKAPIKKGDKLGTVEVMRDGKVIKKLDLLAASDVARKNAVMRFISKIAMIFN
jgi:serine-type D-Ala-D-Ala carboxypeptidase (penicillin-binding protein 5/6)